jgi:glucose/arabinose dehydrogenase
LGVAQPRRHFVPDYLTSVRNGAFYGWPLELLRRSCRRARRAAPSRHGGRATVPDDALGAHVAALGRAFADGARLGPAFADRAFVGRARFVEPAPVQQLQGGLRPLCRGRPVGVEIARDGALLVADDVGNTVWRVSAR